MASSAAELWAAKEPDPLIDVIFLVGSNIAFVPAVLLSWRFGKFAEGMVYLLTGIASTVYHLCDTHTFCPTVLSYNTLQFCDFTFSIVAVVVTVLTMASYPRGHRWKEFFLVICIALVLVGMEQDRFGIGNYVLAGSSSGFVVFIRFCTLIIFFYRRYHRGSERNSLLFPSANRSQYHTITSEASTPLNTEDLDSLIPPSNSSVSVPRFNFWLLLCSGIAVIIGISLFIVDSQSAYKSWYWLLHSTWHILIMSSVALVIMAGKYHYPSSFELDQESPLQNGPGLWATFQYVFMMWFDFTCKCCSTKIQDDEIYTL